MKTTDFQFIKKITELSAPSGMENEVRDFLHNHLKKANVSLRVDRAGNLIAIKGNGGNTLLSAHMDEVGFMIKGFSDDGNLLFTPIGGMNPEILPAKKLLIGKNKMIGIIGAKPIHLKKKDQDKIGFQDLYIDIGAKNREEAMARVSIGDCAVFSTKTEPLSAKTASLCGKAFDDRLGCYLLCKLIELDEIENATFLFTVQEETGLGGANAFAQNSSFEYAIAVDVTTPNDLPESKGPNRVCELGKGPVISLADGRTVYQKALIRKIFRILDFNQIPYQTKALRAGANEASAFQKEGAGMKAISLSVPCRYIHAPVGVLLEKDLENALMALQCILHHIDSGEI